MWKKTLVLILVAIICVSGGFATGYVVQNGGFAGLPALLGFGEEKEKEQDWTGKTLTTGENIVNVRETAEPDGNIVATLNNNTEVVCLNQKTEGWCYVRVMDDVEGYIMTSFLTYVGDYKGSTETETKKTESKDSFLKVTGSYANVRSEAQEESKIVTVVLQDDVLKKTSEDGDWFGVTTADGKKGYISADLVTASDATKAEQAERKTVTITNSFANIRSEANTDSDQVGKLNKGETATYLGEDNGWYYILLDDGTVGYVRNDLASTDATSGE